MKQFLKTTLPFFVCLMIIGCGYWYLNQPKTPNKSIVFGAIGTPTVLTTGEDGDGGSTSTTASVSPTANTLILVTVWNRTGISTDPTQPTISGNGMTWHVLQSTVYDNTSASRRRITMFYSMSASPSSGAISIDNGGQNQTATAWSVNQITGVDTSGTDGAGAIVQSAANQDRTGTATSLTVTLAAFSGANNATFGAFGTGGVAADTTAAGSGFTKLSSFLTAGTDMSVMTEYELANNTAVAMSNGATATELGGIGLEIKVAPTAVPNSGAIGSVSSGVMTVQSGVTLIQ